MWGAFIGDDEATQMMSETDGSDRPADKNPSEWPVLTAGEGARDLWDVVSEVGREFHITIQYDSIQATSDSTLSVSGVFTNVMGTPASGGRVTVTEDDGGEVSVSATGWVQRMTTGAALGDMTGFVVRSPERDGEDDGEGELVTDGGVRTNPDGKPVSQSEDFSGSRNTYADADEVEMLHLIELTREGDTVRVNRRERPLTVTGVSDSAIQRVLTLTGNGTTYSLMVERDGGTPRHAVLRYPSGDEDVTHFTVDNRNALNIRQYDQLMTEELDSISTTDYTAEKREYVRRSPTTQWTDLPERERTGQWSVSGDELTTVKWATWAFLQKYRDGGQMGESDYTLGLFHDALAMWERVRGERVTAWFAGREFAVIGSYLDYAVEDPDIREWFPEGAVAAADALRAGDDVPDISHLGHPEGGDDEGGEPRADGGEDLQCPACGSGNVERVRNTSPIPDAGKCQDCPRNGQITDFQNAEPVTDGGQPEGEGGKLILEYVDDRNPDNGLRSTWYLSDGDVVVHREEWAYNYADDCRERTTDYHLTFSLADDGVTVAHDGRHWKQYARAKTTRGVALGPHTGRNTDPGDVSLSEPDALTDSAFHDTGRAMTDGGNPEGSDGFGQCELRDGETPDISTHTRRNLENLPDSELTDLERRALNAHTATCGECGADTTATITCEDDRFGDTVDACAHCVFNTSDLEPVDGDGAAFPEWIPPERDTTTAIAHADSDSLTVETLGDGAEALFITHRGWEWSFKKLDEHARPPGERDTDHSPVTWTYSPHTLELHPRAAFAHGKGEDGVQMERSYELRDVHPANPEAREVWRDSTPEDVRTDGEGAATDPGGLPVAWHSDAEDAPVTEVALEQLSAGDTISVQYLAARANGNTKTYSGTITDIEQSDGRAVLAFTAGGKTYRVRSEGEGTSRVLEQDAGSWTRLGRVTGELAKHAAEDTPTAGANPGGEPMTDGGTTALEQVTAGDIITVHYESPRSDRTLTREGKVLEVRKFDTDSVDGLDFIRFLTPSNHCRLRISPCGRHILEQRSSQWTRLGRTTEVDVEMATHSDRPDGDEDGDTPGSGARADGSGRRSGYVSPDEYERAGERVDHAEQRNRERIRSGSGRPMTDGGTDLKDIALCGRDGCDELARYVETGDGHAVQDPRRRCHGHKPSGGLWRDIVVAVGRDVHRGDGGGA